MNAVIFSLVSMVSLTVSATDLQWLRDDSRSNPKVLAHLEQQNKLSDNYLNGIRALTDSLTTQWLNAAPNHAETPWLLRKGKGYRIESRDEHQVLVQRSERGEETILLDIDDRRQGHDYYQLGRWSLSPDGRQLALAEDIQGNESYRIVIKDLQTGAEKVIGQKMASYLLWDAKQEAIFAIALEAKTLRAHKLVKLPVGSQTQSSVLWELSDPHAFLTVYTGRRGKLGIIQSNTEAETAQRLLDLSSHQLSAPLMAPKADLQYYADSDGERLVINSNHQGQYQLFERRSDKASWQLLYSPKGRQIRDFHLYRSAIVVVEQKANQTYLVILDRRGEVLKQYPLGAETSVAWVSRNGDFDSDKLRVRSMSMVTPPTWNELNLTTLFWVQIAQDEYPGFDPKKYRTERVWVASGSVKVPVTLAYRVDRFTSASPVMLYGYGAYGSTMRPYFMSQITSLMDRGVVYAVAHVRGGGFFGESWHQQGKGVLKGNGIGDYLACARALTSYQQGDHPILAIGGSAGGTLVAAALNREPSLFAAAVLQVPFVDVVATMSDDSLPLTMQQFGEWGNPNNPEQLAAMKAYDPVLNIKPQAYPPTLIQVGLQDQRVPYWEGAKFHLSLSSQSTARGPYLLRTDFAAGHQADQRDGLTRQAQEYAFLLSQVQLSDSEQ